MVKTPAELYLKLLSDFTISEHVICDLHKPCNKSCGHRCDTTLTHKVIDFDKVKTEYQRGKSEPQKASTDGFTYKESLYCFVELKGWVDFLGHNDPSTLESEIKEQVGKYDLNKKLTDSMLICKDIAEDENIFQNAAIAFILVTDIDINENGAFEFYTDLMNLAETSNNWMDLCNQELKGKLSSLPAGISTYYIKCQEFDKTISKL